MNFTVLLHLKLSNGIETNKEILTWMFLHILFENLRVREIIWNKFVLVKVILLCGG